MTSSLVALIRHGAYEQKPDTPSALQPFPLTMEGADEVRQQARQFAEVLKENNWHLYHEVHSSPLLRAWQTAQIYLEELSEFFKKSPVHLEFAELTERAVGSVANLTVAEIEKILEQDPRYSKPPKNWKSDSHYCLPFLGAESLMQAGERVASHITTHLQLAEENAVQLVIGHGAAIRHAACHLNVMELWQVSGFSMFHAHPVVLLYEKDEHEKDGQQESSWRHIAGQWKQRKKGEEAKD
jgi:2,3-bisphosphoglycerate-dependent phosphoglycerate mutase